MMTQTNQSVPEGSRGCGERLRKAREAAGMSLADVASRLKMPVRVVQSLEAEDWSRLGAPVFVRGQLRSYSRLLGLTTAPVVDASGVAPIEPPVLTPRSFTPPMQRLAEQTARRLVYIVLTIAIAVPVWLATRPHLGAPAGGSAPLDLPTTKPATFGAQNTTPTDSTADTSGPATVIASITPMPERPASPAFLSLHVTGDSWVEVVAPDGSMLEQSLLRAGEQRNYAAGEVARVVIGDTAAVDVLRKGQVQDLRPFERANVARFTVSSEGSLAPAAD